MGDKSPKNTKKAAKQKDKAKTAPKAAGAVVPVPLNKPRV